MRWRVGVGWQDQLKRMFINPIFFGVVAVVMTVIASVHAFCCLIFCVFVFETRSQCCLGCHGNHNVDQVGLKFAEIFLPLPPEC